MGGTCKYGSRTSFVHLEKQSSRAKANIGDEHCTPVTGTPMPVLIFPGPTVTTGRDLVSGLVLMGVSSC